MNNGSLKKIMPSQKAIKLPDRHEEILRELEAIFLSEGFRDINVNDLAMRLKCSKRTLYEVAASKQEIFLIVMSRWLERVRHLGWQGALEHTDPVKRMRAFLEPGERESSRASNEFLRDVQSFLPARQILEKHQAERMEFLKQIIEDGIKRGVFRPLHIHLVAEVYLLSVNRLNDPQFLAKGGLTFGKAFSELYEFLLYGLVHKGK